MLNGIFTQSIRLVFPPSRLPSLFRNPYGAASKTCLASFSSGRIGLKMDTETSIQKDPVLTHSHSGATPSSFEADQENPFKFTHPELSIENLRVKLLTKALELVPQYSFSQKAIHEAAKELNLPSTFNGLVLNGPKELIEFLMDQGIHAIHQAHQEWIGANAAPSGMTKTVIHLTRKRLEFMKPYIYQWPNALRYMAYPSEALFGISQLHRLVDEIWHLAGDQSFDLNYYSKRALLASVYSSTELYMTNDTSADFEKTFKFMDARFQNTKQLGELLKSAREASNWGFQSVKGIFNSR